MNMNDGIGELSFVLAAMINSYVMAYCGKFADYVRPNEPRPADYKDSQENHSACSAVLIGL